MQFVGNHKGVLMSFSTKATKGVEVTIAKLEIRMDEDELGKAVSEDFAAAAFAFCVDDKQQGLIWLTKPFTPGGKYPSHTVKLWGSKGREVQPRIAKINPVKGERAVDVVLELPFPLKGEDDFAGKAHMKCGSQVAVSLEVRQLEMPSATVVKSAAFGNPQHIPAGGDAA